MCKLEDVDNNNPGKQITLLNILIYAVDEYGISHLLESQTLDESKTNSSNTEEKMNEENISKSMEVILNQIDNNLSLTNEDITSKPQQIEPIPNQDLTMNDFQLLPDLSKRKYIYKDVVSSTNNNQINWKMFQCTQQASSISYYDQSVTNGDRIYHPFHSISIPDIRVGLSRHHSIKQLHKIIVD
ncbi:unnamed protein product [Adineta steineri]|uniref:Uncharacterized protein n=1 Tax=Adineta steineri TaxID=433720 RepID=A0A818IP90_9BILA|nr:unnamed protein product [Adineta steineri]